MEIIKNIANESLIIQEEGNKLIEMKFIADEFVLGVYSSKPIIISRDNCDMFYYMLLELMRNDYIFDNPYCKKTAEELIWLSNQCCDLDDAFAVARISRLIIKRIDGNFALFAVNPFCMKNNITKNVHSIVFSPANNGHFSRNVKTERSLQDDVVMAYHNIWSEVPAVRR